MLCEHRCDCLFWLRQGTRRAAQGVPGEEAAKDNGGAGQAPKPALPKPPAALPAARDAPAAPRSSAALPALAERCSTCLHCMAPMMVAAGLRARTPRQMRAWPVSQGLLFELHRACRAGTG